MCPSYLATRDEKDFTRGRARVLQEMADRRADPGLVSRRRSHESLDLCLSCKACASDCPAGVDMAQYKSEVLHRTYRGRLRPVSHYSAGPAAALVAGVRAGLPRQPGRRWLNRAMRRRAVPDAAAGRRDRPAPVGPRLRRA